MSSTQSSNHDIDSILLKEVDLMRAFAQLLEDEQAILVNNQIDQLEALTPDKNRLLNEIFVMEKQRHQSLLGLGFSADLNGMKSFLEKQTASKDLFAAWDALIEISAKAQENNRTNGLLIARHINKNQSALNILQAGNQTVATYGSDGQSKSNTTAGRGIIAG